MRRPGVASTVWFLAFVAVSALLFRQVPGVTSDRAADDIVFAPKNFADSGQRGFEGSVGISGTLTGDGVAYKNNTTVIYCEKDRRECVTYSVEQIGQNHIGRLDYPDIIPITTWNAYEVIATQEVFSWSCRKATITLQRKNETAVWVEEPVNHSAAGCKDAETAIRKWTIENHPRWKATKK